ncbi:hypothetical protein FACS1894137_05500 [Spirochaetia bacterium]|nr:hypothetical protein FACS1894137_05500 [Spirochaetia bacterium]
MFCSNCGERLDDGTKFCFKCGAKVDGSAVDTPVQPVIPQPQTVPVQAVQMVQQPVYQQPMYQQSAQSGSLQETVLLTKFSSFDTTLGYAVGRINITTKKIIWRQPLWIRLVQPSYISAPKFFEIPLASITQIVREKKEPGGSYKTAFTLINGETYKLALKDDWIKNIEQQISLIRKGE